MAVRRVHVGQRDRLIILQRAATSTDEYGDELSAWTDVEQAWARVRFGSASEKREAAQESGIQSATFEVVPTRTLLAAKLTDRIMFDGSPWDIAEVAALERNLMRFTATRTT